MMILKVGAVNLAQIYITIGNFIASAEFVLKSI